MSVAPRLCLYSLRWSNRFPQEYPGEVADGGHEQSSCCRAFQYLLELRMRASCLARRQLWNTRRKSPVESEHAQLSLPQPSTVVFPGTRHLRAVSLSDALICIPDVQKAEGPF